MEGRTGEISFQHGGNPIQHVIYVIKENRTYDQFFGDIREANGDPSLVMYGEDITPNQHKLARQFGILDNFYDSGEVSGDGHVWSTSAITSDYTEKTWQIAYRGKERSYDFDGTVGDIDPLNLGIPDVNDPATGYLWGNLARHNLTYRHYGEFVETVWWCEDMQQHSPASTGGAQGASAGLRAQGGQAGRRPSREARRRQEPVQVRDSFDGLRRGHETGVARPLRPELRRLQGRVSRSVPRR